MTCWNLKNKIILRIFFLSIFIVIFNLSISAQSAMSYYRSNSNGLKLVKINFNQLNKYKYTLKVFSQGRLDSKKILYNGNKEIKRWEYFYKSGYLSYEKYYKNNEIREDYSYDFVGHMIRKGEYKEKNKIKDITYRYNSDGLVDVERVSNLINNSSFTVKYRYDSGFRIKQIEKKHSDGRIIYWEAFFNDKGIIQKEFYTLEDERYTFWYNETGQEIKGEIVLLDKKEDNVKKAWKTFYTDKGNIDRKEEINFLLDREIKTWFNNKNKELRKEVYKKGTLETIDVFNYDTKNRLTFYENIEDLSSKKIIYKYDDNDNLIRTQHYENNELKKDVSFNIEDGTRIEILISKSNNKIMVKYGKDGKMISQELIK